MDLFAGPGGLAEGFSAFIADGVKPFGICLSVEKEKSAHATLLLRSFLRQFPEQYPQPYYDWLNGTIASEPRWPDLFPDEWRAAEHEALNLTLGEADAKEAIDVRLASIREDYGDDTILVGGPPCQAYSLVGRARNRGIDGYDPVQDHRHYLYREYIRILGELRPAAFVMENVKGMLSSSVDGTKIFDRVLADLKAAAGQDSYELFSLSADAGLRPVTTAKDPRDYVIRAEEFGVPQARHRVIVVGIRRDLADRLPTKAQPSLERRKRKSTVSDVIEMMPPLRSGVDGSKDSPEAWRVAIETATRTILSKDCDLPDQLRIKLREIVAETGRVAGASARLPRFANSPNWIDANCAPDLAAWIRRPALKALASHETRSHMAADLARYLFASAYAATTGLSPKAAHFPDHLAPNHRNWNSGKFADRFKVQVWDQPSSTVTSHISKDGHYFIHPDPTQCRSLTVREAARLQTFPDDYFFRGNRTQQFVQVGNAVPPFLAHQIAGALWRSLCACDPRPVKFRTACRRADSVLAHAPRAEAR